MDSKDKMLNDFRKKIGDLERTLVLKDAEIKNKAAIITVLHESAAGIDAVRYSLQAERELTKDINEMLGTKNLSIASLQEANRNLQALNLALQTELSNLRDQFPTGDSAAVITKHQKAEL